MSRAQGILEQVQGAIGGATFNSPTRNHKHTKYLKCQSCGAIHTMPSGVLAPDGLRGPKVDFQGENGGQRHWCPKCGGPLVEVDKTSASVLSGSGIHGVGQTPGGGLHGGAFH